MCRPSRRVESRRPLTYDAVRLSPLDRSIAVPVVRLCWLAQPLSVARLGGVQRDRGNSRAEGGRARQPRSDWPRRSQMAGFGRAPFCAVLRAASQRVP